jgi:adenosylhomocysteine nucleosidase
MKPVAKPLAILSALDGEQTGLLALLQDPHCVRHAGRDFWCGQWHGRAVVLALSRIGKVAAATTATALIERFGAAGVLFTGVAGGVGTGVQVGDVVVGSDFLQHDMDASPLFPRYEVPLYGRALFAADAPFSDLLFQACGDALRGAAYGQRAVTVHRGLIVSGDRFVSGVHEAAALVLRLRDSQHEPLAVEMEGAAVAQVCADYQVPFAAVRTISDRADATAHVDFAQFIEQVAGVYAFKVVDAFVRLLSEK